MASKSVYHVPSKEVMEAGSATAAADDFQSLPEMSELAGMNQASLRKRVGAMGVQTKCRKDDGSGWVWKSKEDILKDCELKLAEAARTRASPSTASDDLQAPPEIYIPHSWSRHQQERYLLCACSMLHGRAGGKMMFTRSGRRMYQQRASWTYRSASA